MADLKVRQIDDRVARTRKARAARRDVSLEEEVRSTLEASVAARRDAFRRRAQALRKVTSGGSGADSAAVIRRERDATG